MLDKLRMALDTPPDFTESFTKSTRQLREDVCSDTGLDLGFEEGGSYTSSDCLVLSLSESGGGVSPYAPEGASKVHFYVSSRAPFVTWLCFPRIEWGIDGWDVGYQNLVTGGDRLVGAVVRSLEERGYVMVLADELEEPALGHFRELDGEPAKVFDVLFAEIT